MSELELKKALYQKKHEARKTLQTINVVKDGYNDHSNYNYISEAEYKKVCTKLLLAHGLELNGSVISVESINGTSRMPIGARVTEAFTLIDIDTGYSETVNSAGDGVDNGDKAIYKAQTGAFKYYIANNFQVTTGDDAETDKSSEPYQPPAPTAPFSYKDELQRADIIAKIEILAEEQGKTMAITDWLMKKYNTDLEHATDEVINKVFKQLGGNK